MKHFENLLYLDRDFISAAYEEETGYAPETKITKTDGLNASARIPLISAGASSVESKSYTVSTIGMLAKLENKLSKYPVFSSADFAFGKPSYICWVSGTLTIEKVEVKRSKHTITLIGKPSEHNDNFRDKLIAEEYYFAIHADPDKFALLPTPDYFVSGVATFQELAGSVVCPIELPVKALIRVYSAQTFFKQCIAVPMIMHD